jgi:hypothetical protein
MLLLLLLLLLFDDDVVFIVANVFILNKLYLLNSNTFPRSIMLHVLRLHDI